MLDISFELNGRKISPNNLADTLEAEILNSIKESIEKSVGNIKCTEHGQYPKLIAKGNNLDSLSLSVSGCCDALIDQVNNKIKEDF